MLKRLKLEPDGFGKPSAFISDLFSLSAMTSVTGRVRRGYDRVMSFNLELE